MKKFYLFILASIVMLFSACHDKIWDAIDDLDARVARLEELCKEMNTNISSLQTIVEVIQENDFITDIVPIKKGGEVIGYTIMFGKHEPITIYNGEDGKDGQNGSATAPIIGVAKDTDGVYYWTLNGEWLLDDEGNKLPVSSKNGNDGENGEEGKDAQNGQDGKPGVDGKDGVTPQLKIENGYWYVSYDNGATWVELGKAVGEDGKDGVDGENGKDGQPGADGKDGQDGDSMFTSVTYDDNNVYFTLTDGSVLIVPRGNSTNDFDQTVIDNLVNFLELNKDTIILNIGGKDTIVATTLPFANSKVIWTSSDTTIVKVDNGIIESVASGVVIITAKAGSLMKESYVMVSKSLGVNNEYVDLGLSVKWAICNVGAKTPEEYGDYFAWGEVEPKSEFYTWSTYKYCKGTNTTLTKYCNSVSYGKDGFIDTKTILDPEDDAATVNWGANWRMPTEIELRELLNNCTWEHFTQNGINGYKITGPSGNSIFIPNAGVNYSTSGIIGIGSYSYYWTSSLSSNPTSASIGNLNSSNVGWPSGGNRYRGHSVRPVCK